MTTYDDLPADVRRENFGWFGEPWWSYVCYDEAGQLIGEMRKAFPAGQSCLYCGEQFSEAAGDSGQATLAVTTEGASPTCTRNASSARSPGDSPIMRSAATATAATATGHRG